VIQLANLGISIQDENLVDLTLNSFPKSWSTFKQIQKGRDRTTSFSELQGLLLQEEFNRLLDKQQKEIEEVNFMRTTRGLITGGRKPTRCKINYGQGRKNNHHSTPTLTNASSSTTNVKTKGTILGSVKSSL